MKVSEMNPHQFLLARECGELNLTIDGILEEIPLEDLERILTIYKAKLIDTKASLLTELEWGEPTDPEDP